MKTKTFFLLALFVSIGAAGAPASGAPDGLRASDWNSIRAEYERHRHAAVPVESGHRARNFGQRWISEFDGRGILLTPDSGGWTWGLRLQSYGWVGQAQALTERPRVTTDTERLSYDWDETLSEWYVNDGRGVEHGFTVRRPPAGRGETLELNLEVRGGLEPRVRAGGRAVAFVDAEGRTTLTYAGLKAWDADGKALDARLETAGAGLRLLLKAAGARYPLTIDPVIQQAYLKASNAGRGDGFGYSVAISGDTAVVAAWGQNGAATGVNGDQGDEGAIASGAAYVFVRDAAGWSQQAYLKASNTDAFDRMGGSLAISGDIVVIGAREEDSNATGVNGDQDDNSAERAGAAYVFARNGTVWSQQAYLKASNTAAGDVFGYSVAVSGDTVVVGAISESSNATGVNGNQGDDSTMESGAVYVFVRNGAVWSQQAYLKASNPDVSDFFGVAVAISGDSIVVGASSEGSSATGVNGDQGDDSLERAGAAYVFVRDGTVWSQQAYLKASNTDAGDVFGLAVAISSDTVVVAAQKEDSNATGSEGDQDDNSVENSGAVYVFVRNGGVWSRQAYLKASNPDPEDRFGQAVAISGDTVVAVAHNEDSNATGIDGNEDDNSAESSGAAYLFGRNGAVWSQQDYLKASNSEAGDFFGYSVAVSGATVVVGARRESSNATGINGNQVDNSIFGAGAAYIFSGDPPPFTAAGLVHAARFEAGDVAEQEIVSLFGLRLADFDADAVLPLGTQLGGAGVDVTDSQGVTRPCLMLAARVETDVSAAQLNFIIAAGTARGPATLTVRRASGGSFSISINVVAVAPGVFTANSSGSGVAAANALRFVDGQPADTSLVFDTAAFPFQATPIDLGPENNQVFLSLFLTGVRNGGTVEVTIGGVPMTTVFGPAPSSEFEGLEQLNVLLDRVLIGSGLVQVVVTVDGVVANVVEINIL